MMAVAVVVSACGLYALIRHPSQAQWGRHDDDVVTLVAWIGLSLWTLRAARGDRVFARDPRSFR